MLRISYDPIKSALNEVRRGLPFDRVKDFDFRRARVAIDDRRDYGEVRYVAIGPLDGRLHVLCFTETPQGLRVISLRRANQREIDRHAQEGPSPD